MGRLRTGRRGHMTNQRPTTFAFAPVLSGNLEGPKVFDNIPMEKPTWQMPKVFPPWVSLMFWNQGKSRQLLCSPCFSWNELRQIPPRFVYVGYLQWLKSLETRRNKLYPEVLSKFWWFKATEGEFLSGVGERANGNWWLPRLGIQEFVFLCRDILMCCIWYSLDTYWFQGFEVLCCDKQHSCITPRVIGTTKEPPGCSWVAWEYTWGT